MNKSETIVDDIIGDLCERKDLKEVWYSIDYDVQREIRDAWVLIVSQER